MLGSVLVAVFPVLAVAVLEAGVCAKTVWVNKKLPPKKMRRKTKMIHGFTGR